MKLNSKQEIKKKELERRKDEKDDKDETYIQNNKKEIFAVTESEDAIHKKELSNNVIEKQ